MANGRSERAEQVKRARKAKPPRGEDMRGVTDPRILLKASDQRIDKNVYTPEQADVNRKFWAKRQRA